MEEVVKKKRGRPRKAESKEPKIKRPRGRPRKEVTGEVKPKRPRGRPRKPVDLTPKVKRARGRPRKNPVVNSAVEKEINGLIAEREEFLAQNTAVAVEKPQEINAPALDFDEAEELFLEETMDIPQEDIDYEDEVYDAEIIENIEAREPLIHRSIREATTPKLAKKEGIIPAKHLKSEPVMTYEDKALELEETFAPVPEMKRSESFQISKSHKPVDEVWGPIKKPIRKTKNTNATKVVLITGATSGLGLAMATNLAGLGQVVLAVGRRPSACRDARNEILAKYPDAKIHFLVADLSLMGQVRMLAEEVRQKIFDLGYDCLDVLIHNAGIQTNIHKITYENHEIMWATNYLSAFLLTRELQPLLDASHNARIITTTNDDAHRTELEWEHIRALTPKSDDDIYNQTKLADLMFALEYDHRFADRDDIHAYCVNPGRVDTELRSKNSKGWGKFKSRFGKKNAKTIEQGIETTMFLALAERLPRNTVLYENKKPTEPCKFALDPRNRAALWRYTELELNN